MGRCNKKTAATVAAVALAHEKVPTRKKAEELGPSSSATKRKRSRR